MSPRLAVIGDPIHQSVSPALHRAAFRACGLEGWTYEPVLVPAGELSRVWRDLAASYLGVNVTAPHKRAAAAAVDRLGAAARACGSVNCITFRAGSSLGESTDGAGFVRALGDIAHRTPEAALVMGAGGAARAVAVALRQLGTRVEVAARDPGRALALVRELELGSRGLPLGREALACVVPECDLLVNATPLGADGAGCPLPQGVTMSPGTVVFELIYSRSETELGRRARAQGGRWSGGLGMLVEQAALSFERWTSLPAPRAEMWAAGRAALESPVP